MPKNTTKYTLTGEGMDRLAKGLSKKEGTATIFWLSAISRNRPITIYALSREVGTPQRETQRKIQELMRLGFVDMDMG